MATTKRHIAVYLNLAVEQALKEFCEQRGLKSKKGAVLSAGVNAVLAEFFGISDSDIEEGSTPIEPSSTPIEPSSTPIEPSSTPGKVSSTPGKVSSTLIKASNIPTNFISNTPVAVPSSIPPETLAVEVLPGKLQA